MRKYVLYLRVSSAEQGKSGLGLEAQERDIQLFLENYAETPYGVVERFVEVHSGKDNERPLLNAAIALAKREKGGGTRRFQTGSVVATCFLHRFLDGRQGAGLQSRPDATRRQVSTPHLCLLGRAGTRFHLPENEIGTTSSKGERNQTWCAKTAP